MTTDSTEHLKKPTQPLKTVVITCAVLEDEIRHYRTDLDHIIHVEFMEQGLHNEPETLRRKLQEKINQLEKQFTDAQAIVLGYGLCSKGTESITAQRCTIVLTRAHDCITLLLGSKERYAEYITQHPGTYWYSPGWNRHHTPPGKERYEKLYSEYLEKYGEDNAQFLMETEQHWFSTYDRAAYVDLDVGATDKDIQYTKDCANWLDWNFDHQKGDPTLLYDLLAGNWDDQRFLIVKPGQTIRFCSDAQIVKAVKADAPETTQKNDSAKDTD